ncbi:hypothetical protein AB0442_16800 [Kitasatospora sp. NPDC085895]|uniref:hypothetical protein n=1 Tax=Kitasatospora sp. NPDC085895 TaxID=3155057 RepID=UPI00344CE151
MRSPDELDGVQWDALDHAYGPAEDVPELIRALYGEDEEAASEAVHELFGNIHHQGTVYEASGPAVPFLAHAVRHAPGHRTDLLMLLAVMADHDPSAAGSPPRLGADVAAVCTELCRVLPDLLPCLGDAEPSVRRAALRVVGAVADLLPAGSAAPTLVEGVYAADPVPAVRADAATVLALLGRGTGALDHPLREVRLAVAVLEAERSGPPYRPELVAVVAADGAEPGPREDDLPWADGTVRGDRLAALLVRDADAALAVAARWIAAGDLGSCGSWLARDVAEAWRDREPEVVDLLLAALPHQPDPQTRGARLHVLADWIRHLPEPGAELRDTLHRHAVADDPSSGAALLALVHARDPRALDLLLDEAPDRAPDHGPGRATDPVPGHPGSTLLSAAARSFPDAADRLVPAIRRALAAGADGNAAVALVGALERFGPAARQARPELTDCLRTGRAAIVAARLLGLLGERTEEVTGLLQEAALSTDSALSGAAAAAHHRLTGEAGPALRTFERLLSGGGQTSWYLAHLQSLGAAAAPLLPVVERLLDGGDWTRLAAAEAHHRITGSPDRAVPVLAGLAGPSPVGLAALRALAAIGRTPEELRPTLRGLAFSPLRLLTDSGLSATGHPDEELRALARTLLAAGPAAEPAATR